MPTATPTASSIARRRRWPIVSPSVITAEIGAKKASSWPTTSVATSHASAAAMDVCRIGRALVMIRSRRERRPAREASLACSSSSSRERGALPIIADTSAETRSAAAQCGPCHEHGGPVDAQVEAEHALEVLAEAVHRVGAHAEGARQRHEVGRVQVDALVWVALEVLVEAQHAVAAVVHDHGGDRDALLSRGGQLAAGIRKPPSPEMLTTGPAPASAAPSACGNAQPSVPQPSG